jgi:hypothetical protein
MHIGLFSYVCQAGTYLGTVLGTVLIWGRFSLFHFSAVKQH